MVGAPVVVDGNTEFIKKRLFGLFAKPSTDKLVTRLKTNNRPTQKAINSIFYRRFSCKFDRAFTVKSVRGRSLATLKTKKYTNIDLKFNDVKAYLLNKHYVDPKSYQPFRPNCEAEAPIPDVSTLSKAKIAQVIHATFATARRLKCRTSARAMEKYTNVEKILTIRKT